MSAKLALLRSGGAPEVISLGQAPVSLGRDADNGIVIDGPDISRRHCTFVSLPDHRHAVMDLESTNGLVVNDRRVTQAVLEPFDRVTCGDTTIIYLGTGTDPDKVLNLVSLSSSATSQSPTLEPGGLRDLLLWLILSLEGLGSEEEVYPLLGNVFEDLLERSGYGCALLVQTREHEGVTRLEPVQWRQVPAAVLREESLAACLPLVEEALVAHHVTRGSSPLAAGQRTLCIPMQSRPRRDQERRRSPVGRVEGALLLGAAGSEGRLDVGDQVLLQALLRQVAVLVANTRLQQQATTDPLTQLSSRGSIEQTLVSEVSRARAEEIPLGVILLDVDDFKRVNDTYGHPAGDEVLRQIGQRLNRELRADDTAGRWGGEEFIVILPGNDARATQIVADKIVRMVASLPLGSTGIRATISAGVCSFPGEAASPEELVRRADVALYAAKRRGKDQAVRWSKELSTPLQESMDPGRTQRMSAVRFRPDVDAPPVAWLQGEFVKPVPLRPGVLSVGRGQDCDITLPHPSVSRVHGLIHVDSEEGPIRYEDRSTNGSVVNERPVLGTVEIHVADRLEIGPFSFQVRRHLRNPAGEDTMAGDIKVGRLENIPLCDLLKRLGDSGSEGLIAVCGAGGVGDVALKAGTPWRARLGDRRGDDALRGLLAWKKGSFSFEPEEIGGPKDVTLPLGMLLDQCRGCQGADCPMTRLGRSCPAQPEA